MFFISGCINGFNNAYLNVENHDAVHEVKTFVLVYLEMLCQKTGPA